MIWNVVDHRTNKYDRKCDAVFEPAFHDNSIEGASRADKDDSWTITSDYDATVRDALLEAESNWEGPVSVYLYDPGSKPLR